MSAYSEVVIPIAEPQQRLRKSVSWTLAGNLVYACCQWGMISALAKLSTAAVVGQFALGLAISAPVFMLTNLQLRGAQATDSQQMFRLSSYFTLRFLSTCLGLLAIAVVLAFCHYDRQTMAVVMLTAVAKAIESLSDVVAGFLQQHERLDQVAIALMARGVLSVSAFVIVFRMTQSLIAAVAATSVAWLMVLLAYELRQAFRISRGAQLLAFNRSALNRLVRLCAPLGVVMAMGSLSANIPRYVLERSLGIRDLGIFASLAYLLIAASFVVNAVGQSTLVRLSRMFAESHYDRFLNLIKKSAGFACFFGIAGMCATALFGRVALRIVYRPEYAEHMPTLMILACATAVGAIGSFFGYGMTASRSFKQQVPITVVSTFVGLIASLTLIPRFGLPGAACAVLIGATVQTCVSGTFLLHVLRSRRSSL
jgi:O-antigen/teichoic acid export membrane protein